MSYDKLWHGWLRHSVTSWNVAGSIPEGSLGFFIEIIFPVALRPRVESAANKNEYQEYIPG